jgi:hypothetical protein
MPPAISGALVQKGESLKPSHLGFRVKVTNSEPRNKQDTVLQLSLDGKWEKSDIDQVVGFCGIKQSAFYSI